MRYSVSLASSRAGSPFQDAKIPPDMAIPHYAAIFFAGSRSASRVGRLRNWTQGFGSFERQFEGLKRLHGMAAVSRDAKRSV